MDDDRFIRLLRVEVLRPLLLVVGPLVDDRFEGQPGYRRTGVGIDYADADLVVAVEPPRAHVHLLGMTAVPVLDQGAAEDRARSLVARGRAEGFLHGQVV